MQRLERWIMGVCQLCVVDVWAATEGGWAATRNQINADFRDILIINSINCS